MAANLIDRWREWGLSSAEIERLTRADQRSEALERRLRMRGDGRWETRRPAAGGLR